MIYIVSSSDFYYPAGGCSDWTFVTKDFAKAEHRALADVGAYKDTWVVRVDPDTLYYDVIRHFGEDGREFREDRGSRDPD